MPFDTIDATLHVANPAPAAGKLTLRVRMPDGGWLAPPAEAGVRVTDLLARFGLPMRDACGGRCACADCRADILPAWRHRLAPPRADEAALLSGFGDDGDFGRTRLLCGLVMTPDLDGLELALHWDALTPQTHWIAG
jgi:ferredoxin